MDSSNKKKLPVLLVTIKISESKAKNINIAIIGANAYYAACCSKEAQVFVLSIKDIQY